MSERIDRDETYAVANDPSGSQRDFEVTTEHFTDGVYDDIGSEKSLEQARQKRKTKKKCKLVCLVLVPCLIISLIAVIIYLTVHDDKSCTIPTPCYNATTPPLWASVNTTLIATTTTTAEITPLTTTPCVCVPSTKIRTGTTEISTTTPKTMRGTTQLSCPPCSPCTATCTPCTTVAPCNAESSQTQSEQTSIPLTTAEMESITLCVDNSDEIAKCNKFTNQLYNCGYNTSLSSSTESTKLQTTTSTLWQTTIPVMGDETAQYTTRTYLATTATQRVTSSNLNTITTSAVPCLMPENDINFEICKSNLLISYRACYNNCEPVDATPDALGEELNCKSDCFTTYDNNLKRCPWMESCQCGCPCPDYECS